MSKVIGILGGMGPMATVDLFKKIVEITPSKSDQDHLRIIINNNPKIPSRIQAILNGTHNPLPEMEKSAKLLEKAGVDFILIPCHTAHYWLNNLQQTIKIPIYSLVETTTSYIKEHYKHLSNKILLLASEATIKLKLYQNAVQAFGLDFKIPNYDEQKIVSSAITEVKAGHIRSNSYIKSLNLIINQHITKGFSAVLGGCTEISLLFPYLEDKIKKIDPTLILAKKAVIFAK